MIRKIKDWFERRRISRKYGVPLEQVKLNDNPKPELYTREQVQKIADEYGDIRYNDGKRDGLAIARQQATQSLKEILWHQNKQKK